MKGWSILSGKLPEELELNPITGEIYGTPKESGDFVLEVRLENDCGVSVEWITVSTYIKLYSLIFTVSDDNGPILDANIVCLDDKNNPVAVTNNGDGTYKVEIPDGEYTYSISKDGYYTKTGSVIVNGENVYEEPILKSSIHTLTFTVFDGVNSVLDAIVDCFDNENNPVTVTNNGDGTYSIKVPDGTYTYTTSKSGFNTVNGSKIINGDNENVSIVLVPIPEEIIHVIDSSSGEFIVPTSGWGNSNMNVSYNWVIEGSLDGENYMLIQNASGTGSLNGGISLTIPSGLQSTNMYLKIRDFSGNNNYGWARAFGFYPNNAGSGLLTNKVKVKSANIYSCQKGFRLDGTTELGNNFLYNIWSQCTSLQTVILPDTSGWNVTSIGDFFLRYTWYGCTSLVNVVSPDTSNWNVTSIGDGFLYGTWGECTSLVTAVVPDTSGWNVTSIGDNFLYQTFYNSFSTSGTRILTIPDNVSKPVYTGSIRTLQSNSADIPNFRINEIYVPCPLVSAFRSSSSWSNITPKSKFIECTYLLNFTVTDGSNPVSDANVVCLDSGNNPISITNNGNSTYSANVPDGTYSYTVSKTGFQVVNGSVIINGNNNVNVVLVPIPEAIILVIDSSSGFVVPDELSNVIGKNVPYNWIIEGSLDGINYTFIRNASSNYSTSGISLTIPPGLQSTNMYLRIRDFTGNNNYGWARAFGFSYYNTTLSGVSTNRAKVKSADISSCQKGFRLDGTTSLGDSFLEGTWNGCINLQTVILPDTSSWNITSIGDYFLGGTWFGCSSLVTSVVPDTSNWVVTNIGSGFLSGTWRGCTSLVNAKVPNTTNWKVSGNIGSGFLGFTWNNCSSLVTSVIPDTSNWIVSSIEHDFLLLTWAYCNKLETVAVPNTTNWKVSGNIGHDFLSATWMNCALLVTADAPDTSNWTVTGSIGDYFLQETWQGCISLVTAVVPDTSGWNVNSIGNQFMALTWRDCTSLATADVPDTSNWNINKIKNFLSATWSGCSSLVTAVVPNTNGWNVTTIEGGFLSGTWINCSKIQTSVVPDTSGWNVTIIGTSFLDSTWSGCTSLQVVKTPNTSGWSVSGDIGNFLSYTWSECKKIQTAVVPDTSSWNVNSIGDGFLRCTWRYCFLLETVIFPNTSNWNVSTIGSNYFLHGTFQLAGYELAGTTMLLTIPDNILKPIYRGDTTLGDIEPLANNSADISNYSVFQIKVPSALVSSFQTSPSWSNITSSKFVAI